MDQNGSLAFGCHPLCRTRRVRRFAACGLDLEGVGMALYDRAACCACHRNNGGDCGFRYGHPRYDRKFLFLPALPLAIWLGSLGDGCVEDWIHFGPDGLSLQPDWFCFPTIVLVGAVPAIAMAVMLRRGAPLTPHVTSALGGLAAAGLGNFGLRLFHSQDVSVMVLVWQVGAVCVLAAIAALAGRYLLNWRSIITTKGGSVLLHRL